MDCKKLPKSSIARLYLIAVIIIALYLVVTHIKRASATLCCRIVIYDGVEYCVADIVVESVKHRQKYKVARSVNNPIATLCPYHCAVLIEITSPLKLWPYYNLPAVVFIAIQPRVVIPSKTTTLLPLIIICDI